ncbi:MAG: 2-oxo acid dehydrogenase subunit E2 [Alphaproteobacteria bacterium]|nr:2-oxo acid dehydrogenase subunit E2 [Alphaproteobacteria bacterium]
MAEFFEMPQASPTMETGTLLAWKKPEGAELAPQDVIAEVETDKAAMDIEVFDKGFLLKILAEEGEEIPAGQPIAIIGKAADEDISALMKEFERRVSGGSPAPAAPKTEPAAKAPAKAPAKPVAEPVAEPAAAPATAPTPAAAPQPAAGYSGPTWEGKTINSAIMETWGTFAYGDAPGRVRASPLARRIAAEKGVDLASVDGSGPHGRVVKADVLAASARPAPVAGPAPAEDTVVRNTKMRKVIAKRLKESYLGSPVFFLTANFDCDRLVAFRKDLNAQLVEARGVKVSYNDLTVAAVARALRDVPECNATWGDDAITRFGAVDVGVAVALEDGLITPVVRSADQKPLATLATEIADLVGRARARKLQPEEYSGAGFAVSNLGMMGIEQFTAIINPPASGILAVGALQQEPVVVNGALGIGWRMRVTMTCDHRVIDGALGARYLLALRRYIENPLLMVV